MTLNHLEWLTRRRADFGFSFSCRCTAPHDSPVFVPGRPSRLCCGRLVVHCHHFAEVKGVPSPAQEVGCARIRALNQQEEGTPRRDPNGWITALRASATRTLMADDGPLQLSISGQQDLAEVTSPDFPANG